MEKADERLKYWIRQSRLYPTNRDAIDGALIIIVVHDVFWISQYLNFSFFTVMRGLLELRKMGIETQIWQASYSSS